MMRGTVSIVVGTYGDAEYWNTLADRAIDSAKNQTVAAEVVRSHGRNLMEARNFGAEEATGEWLIFLDADDSLDFGYVEAMLAGSGDIRQPSTLGIVDGVPEAAPVLIAQRPLLQSNYLIIGSMVRRSMFLDNGGFEDYPILEDWALWLKLWVNGAEIGACPDAIYKVNVNPNGRNNHDPETHGHFYALIRQRFMQEAAVKGLL
jgi:glycosyltransferase involved in cell wall biosynthesis